MNHFEKTPQSPEVPEPDYGIALDATPNPTVYGSLAVYGAFHLPVDLLERVGRPVQRSVVLVIQREHSYSAITPFKDHVLFQDDDRLTPGGVAGYFVIDVFSAQQKRLEGDYHLFVSMGEHISNVVQLTVTN